MIFLLRPFVLMMLLTTSLAADEGRICRMSSADLERIEALREAMSVVNLTVGPDDVATGIGLGVIDSSCLTGQRLPFRAQTIQAIREAITRAVEQSQNCFNHMRIREMPDVISVLHRTRYKCNDPAGDGLVASMRRTSRTYDSCGRPTARYMAGAHRRYEMTMSAPSSVLPPKLNQTASTNMQTEDLAAFFAHEAMHVLAMNNRGWHNTFADEDRLTTGCNSSRFEDRIYFTQAACFPDSEIGRDFYSENGPYQCPGLCQRALTEVDEEAVGMYHATAEPGAERTGAFGPSQVARPYDDAEAGRICQRISTTRGRDISN